MLSEEDTISVGTALRAMFLFWNDVYIRTRSGEVGDVLSDLSLLEDGSTADPAAFEDFCRCIERVNTDDGREAVRLVLAGHPRKQGA
jgi:hypothetical protein